MNTENHSINVNDKHRISSVWQIPDDYRAVLIIAHGAGNDMHSDFISFLHERIAEHNILTVKFNFPYKEQGKKAPDRRQVLEATWQAVIDTVLEKTGCRNEQIVISGKSMGGRYASMIAARRAGLGGVILYGYPLHAPGKPDKIRVEHLPAIACPMLFIQGTRDSLCNLEALQSSLAALDNRPELHTIVGGDHSFKVLKKLNRGSDEVWSEIVNKTVQWINQAD